MSRAEMGARWTLLCPILMLIMSIILGCFVWTNGQPFLWLFDVVGGRLVTLVNGHHRHPVVGHLQPLGAHRPPQKDGVDVLDWCPAPSDFFKKYVQPGRPVLFRKLAEHMPAYSWWSDAYLRSHYGLLNVTVELRKVEDRTGRALNLTLVEFLQIYQNEDVYLVHSVPYEMLNDVHLPKCISCQNLLNVLTDVVLWMSSGGTKSVLHYDELDNINCVLDGSKEFFLVDKAEESHVEIVDRREGYSPVDVDSVDFYRYPGLSDVPWYNVTVRDGDCLFIPYRWFHQVRSYGDRNLALNIWFVHLYWIDTSSCNDSDVRDGVPFEHMDFCPASECLRAELVGLGNGTDPMVRERFREIYGPLVNSNVPVDSVFSILDFNDDGSLSLEEMYKPNAAILLSLFRRFLRNRI